jgi:hypothetical protein
MGGSRGLLKTGLRRGLIKTGPLIDLIDQIQGPGGLIKIELGGA